MKKCLDFSVKALLDITKTRKPNFNNIIKVLNRQIPDRFTLFEFFLNGELYMELTGYKQLPERGLEEDRMKMKAFKNAGYDYCTLDGSTFSFPNDASNHGKKSRSANEGNVITDRESFDAYVWPNPESFDYSKLDTLTNEMPDGMKIIVCGPGGVLENVTYLVGYDNLCYMLIDDPELVAEIFKNVGERLVKYYEIVSQYSGVGALISNDDWGFNTQTMLSPDDMRKYVFPWHKKIVETIHQSGKPALLHSCGNLKSVIDDIVNDMKYDGKHSYEDNIIPVEKAYEKWGDRIATLGGIDLDFVCRSIPKEIYSRACNILKQSEKSGGYALGSGNSIPYYVPYENYIAMIMAALINE